MDFGGLMIVISCRDAFAESFEATHLRLGPASGVGSGLGKRTGRGAAGIGVCVSQARLRSLRRFTESPSSR